MRATHLVFWSPISGLLMAMLTACGGDSGSGSDAAAQFQQTCMKLCNKENECNPGLNFNCTDFCSPKGGGNPATSGGGSTSSDCDTNAFLKKENECISGSCADLVSCQAEASAICSGSKGSGGSNGAGASSSGTGASSSGTGASSSGSGASTGAGGSKGSGASTGSGGSSSSGTADCSACDAAATCCMMANLGSCGSLSKATCDMAPSSVRAMVAKACQDTVDGYKSAGLCM